MLLLFNLIYSPLYVLVYVLLKPILISAIWQMWYYNVSLSILYLQSILTKFPYFTSTLDPVIHKLNSQVRKITVETCDPQVTRKCGFR